MLPPLMIENRNERKKQKGPNVQIEPSLSYSACNNTVNKLDFDDLDETLIDKLQIFLPSIALHHPYDQSRPIRFDLNLKDLVFLTCVRQHIHIHSLRKYCSNS